MDENKDDIIENLKRTLINYEKTMIKLSKENKKEIEKYKYQKKSTDKVSSYIEYDFICDISSFDTDSLWKIDYSKSYSQSYQNKMIYNEEKMQNIIIGLLGRVNSGKSHLLNCIIDNDNIIQHSHTKDISVKYNDDNSIVVIDTKGFDSFDSDEKKENFIKQYITNLSHIVIYVTNSITRTDKSIIDQLSQNNNIKLFIVHNLYMCFSSSEIISYINVNLKTNFNVTQMNFDNVSSSSELIHYYASNDNTSEHFVIGNSNTNEEDIMILNKKVLEYIKGYINSIKNVISYDPIESLQKEYESYSNRTSELRIEFDNKYIVINNK